MPLFGFRGLARLQEEDWGEEGALTT